MNASYRLEWSYLGELPEVAGIPYKYKLDEAHCDFLIRFLDVPPGDGHCAFLCVNVVTPAKAAELGVGPNGRRGYFVADAMTRADFCRRVTEDVRRAFDELPRPQALARLDETYVWRDQDYRDEFLDDVPRGEDLAALIEEAFASPAQPSPAAQRRCQPLLRDGETGGTSLGPHLFGVFLNLGSGSV